MSVWSFTGLAALNVLGEVFHAGFYLVLLLIVLAAIRQIVCDIIDNLYECKKSLYQAQIAPYIRDEVDEFDEDESASQQPPLHIV